MIEEKLHLLNDIMEKNEILLTSILLHNHEVLKVSSSNLKSLYAFLEKNSKNIVKVDLEEDLSIG